MKLILYGLSVQYLNCNSKNLLCFSATAVHKPALELCDRFTHASFLCYGLFN